jgi:tRNA threonylcarbamoyl adenosine modification protein (Sua5/YciO/YrdC/YwlC family)
VAEAVAALARGELAVIPTDTVYGVAGRLDVHAIDALFALKQRPYDKPLPVLAADADALSEIAVLDRTARALARRWWPGPLTLVVPRAEGFGVPLGRGGEGSVAVRVPAHSVALSILTQSGPVAVTSANRSGESEAHTLAQARAVLGDDVKAYVDGGTCDSAPSTVLSLVRDEPRVLRAGAVSEADLAHVLGQR